MEQLNLNFDNGVKEYSINGRSTLRFTPADPNVYARYVDCIEKINDIEADMRKTSTELDENATDYAKKSLDIMRDADTKVKAMLGETFGIQNDFDAIFDGVNVMAVAVNGKMVITNFMEMMAPVLEDGAKRFVDQAVEQKQLNRKQRRAMQK